MSRVRSHLICIAAVSCLCMTAAGADPLYKWVDQQGAVHYSQTPPPNAGTKVKPMDVTVTPANATAVLVAQDLQRQELAQQAQAQQAAATKAQGGPQDEQVKAQQEARCYDAHTQLDSYEHADDSLSPRQKGERKYTADLARQQRLDFLKQQVERACGPGQ